MCQEIILIDDELENVQKAKAHGAVLPKYIDMCMMCNKSIQTHAHQQLFTPLEYRTQPHFPDTIQTHSKHEPIQPAARTRARVVFECWGVSSSASARPARLPPLPPLH